MSPCWIDETGSWDPALGAFTPTKYLGSPNSSVCVTGYDQLSFIEGVSSNLFTEYNVSVRLIRFSLRMNYSDTTLTGRRHHDDGDWVYHRGLGVLLP